MKNTYYTCSRRRRRQREVPSRPVCRPPSRGLGILYGSGREPVPEQSMMLAARASLARAPRSSHCCACMPHAVCLHFATSPRYLSTSLPLLATSPPLHLSTSLPLHLLSSLHVGHNVRRRRRQLRRAPHAHTAVSSALTAGWPAAARFDRALVQTLIRQRAERAQVRRVKRPRAWKPAVRQGLGADGTHSL